MSLKDAFNTMLSLKQRQVTYFRHGQSPITIFASPSNWFRNTQAPADMVIEGREFVIRLNELESTYANPPRRGDVIRDTQLGDLSIANIQEIYDLGGGILGWRVQTS